MQKCETFLLMFFNYLTCHLILPSIQLCQSSKPRLTWVFLHPLTVQSQDDSCLPLTLYFNWYLIINNGECNMLRGIYWMANIYSCKKGKENNLIPRLCLSSLLSHFLLFLTERIQELAFKRRIALAIQICKLHFLCFYLEGSF